MTVEYTTERSDAVRAALIRQAQARPRPRTAGGARGAALAATGALLVAACIAAGVHLSGSEAELPRTVPAAVPLLRERVVPGALVYFDTMSTQPGFVDGGYDPDGSADLTLYWDGPLGGTARDVVADAAAHGVSIAIVQVAHSTTDAWGAATRLVAALERAHVEIEALGLTGANDTIQLSGPQVSMSPEVQARVHEIALTTIGPDYAIEIGPDEKVTPAVAGR